MGQPEATTGVSANTANAPVAMQTSQENPGSSLEGTALKEKQRATDKKPEVLLMKPQTGLFYPDSQLILSLLSTDTGTLGECYWA